MTRPGAGAFPRAAGGCCQGAAGGASPEAATRESRARWAISGPVGAENSAVVVDLPRCGPMLNPRVPNLVPIPGITGSAHCAVRPLEGPRDHRVAPPTRCAAPANRPTRAHRRRPQLARRDRGRARATEPNRVAGHPRHAVALAPAPHRRALDPVGAGNSAVVVDLPRCGPMLSPRVPNLVPIPGPRMERETPGQRPRPNYGHPQVKEPTQFLE